MSEALSRLCLACGLCCDGSLFQFVSVSLEEAGALRARGQKVIERRKKEVLALPCGALEGKCCRVYEVRPQGCRAFTCLVGRRLVAGTLPEAEARTFVDGALERIERLGALLAAPEGESVLMHARRVVGEPGQRVSAEACEALREADAYVREHFIGT